MNQGWTYQEQVSAVAQGLTVLDYYTQHYRHSSRSQWQQRIETGQVLLNEARTMPDTCLKAGQRLTYHRPPWQEAAVPLEFDILYSDPELLVVNKPAGLPVLPGGGFLQHTLLWQLQQRYPKDTPFPIHRLGRGTSGLLLLARSPRARAFLSQQLRDHQMQKIYRTLVSGLPDREQFTVTQPIGKLNHPVLGHLFAAHPTGLPAQSDCRVLQRYAETALLEVAILTGRPHQIRIHMAAAGYPLVGDPLYGVGGLPIVDTPSETGELPVPGDCGYFLHAMYLKFTHPNGQPIHLICPPPPELEEL